MSAPPILANSTHTCKEYEPQCVGHTQKALLYAGLALIAVGVAGNLVSVKPFLEEQKLRESAATTEDTVRSNNNNTGAAAAGDPYQVLGLIGVVVVAIAGAVALPYIKPWTLRFGIPAICTVIGTTLFLSGSFTYKKEPPSGSPICNVCRVFVSAALNAFQSYPTDNQSYHGIDERRFSKTSCLRGLHKAAIRPAGEENREINNTWRRLCSVAEVEDAKIAVRMVPMWLTFVLCGVVASAGDTYFVEQAGKLNRNVGKLKLPIQVLLLARRSTKDWLDPKLQLGFLNRNIQTAPASAPASEPASRPALLFWMQYAGAPSIGIGMGMICAILCCISAAGVEKMRLAAVNNHGLLDKPDEDVPMSIYWLLFQFILLGGLDSFLEKSMNAYYREQAPESMETYLENFTRGVSGLGFMSSALSVYVVGRISEGGGRRNWFQETLNRSRLDRYYWVLAALSSVNFVVFVFVASRYRYKEPGRRGQDEIDGGGSYTDGYEESSACFGCC